MRIIGDGVGCSWVLVVEGAVSCDVDGIRNVVCVGVLKEQLLHHWARNHSS